VDPDTDPEARDLDSGWGVGEGQAAGPVPVAERGEAAARARQEVAAAVPAYGSQVARAVLAARGQELAAGLVQALVEVEQVAVVGLAPVALVAGVEPAADMAPAEGQGPEEVAREAVGLAVVAGQGLVGLVVEARQEPAVALVAAWAEVDLEVAAGREPEVAEE
jgi:hypothetical protein